MKNAVFPSRGPLWRELEGELLRSKDADFDWRHSAFSIGGVLVEEGEHPYLDLALDSPRSARTSEPGRTQTNRFAM